MHDRLSFQRFLPLDPLTQKVPDETTVLHFRHTLERPELSEAIFARVRAQLEARGLLVRAGPSWMRPSSPRPTAPRTQRAGGTPR